MTHLIDQVKQLAEPQEPASVGQHRYRFRCVFFASDDASYMTGQVLHPSGDLIINGESSVKLRLIED
ncbi:hypothetical protein [Novipirellula aureliae]|uniref:hypothetical protein n=1 Tax=Novipirellula aureliae TaxID=2527966 RepID=UPI0011B6CC4D|nr:hypothetical protein [Novipirellula aureliae]